MRKTATLLAVSLLVLMLAGCGENINDTPGYEVPDVYVAVGEGGNPYNVAPDVPGE